MAAVSRRNLIGLLVVDVVLFLLANVTSNSHKHPGTLSNIFWFAFLAGVVLLIVGVIVAVVMRLRGPKTARATP